MTIRINGAWYEVETTECYTYMILRDRYGNEIKLHSDEPLAIFLQACDLTEQPMDHVEILTLRFAA